jgi:hypothetical protein
MRVSALRQLVTWGVLAETEGGVGVVEQDDGGEAVIPVDREMARAEIAGPLTQSSGGELVGRAAEPGFGGRALTCGGCWWRLQPSTSTS